MPEIHLNVLRLQRPKLPRKPRRTELQGPCSFEFASPQGSRRSARRQHDFGNACPRLRHKLGHTRKTAQQFRLVAAHSSDLCGPICTRMPNNLRHSPKPYCSTLSSIGAILAWAAAGCGVLRSPGRRRISPARWPTVWSSMRVGRVPAAFRATRWDASNTHTSSAHVACVTTSCPTTNRGLP